MDVINTIKFQAYTSNTFQDQGSETYGLVKNVWSIDPNTEASYIDHYSVMDGKPSDNERMVIKGKPVDIHFGIENLLKECDYICNVLPKTSETDNILGHDKLRLCKGILSQGTWLFAWLCLYVCTCVCVTFNVNQFLHKY